jgi:multiple antibiotic resistance protein
MPTEAGVDMTLASYLLLAFSSLFVIVDPIATVPAFLAMTPHDTPAERIRMARLASIIMGMVLVAFAVLGQHLFRFLGITLPAFQMAGSIVLLLIALDMLRAQRTRASETKEEVAAGAEKDDIAVTPLAVPMLAGPGAISSVLLLQGKADSFDKRIGLCGVIVLVAALSYLVFAVSARGARWLSPIVLRIVERIMGLLLAAIAMQFMVNALVTLGIIPNPPS